MGTIYVDNIKEHTTGNGVKIPGHVIQVQHSQTTTQVTTQNTLLHAPTDTGLAVSITPKFITSKMLIMINAGMRGDGGTAWVNAMIKRDNNLIDYSPCTDNGILDYGFNHTASRFSVIFEDLAGSTDTTEYRMFFSRYGGSGTSAFNNNGNHYSLSTMTVMEVSA